jgi:holo-[acyl-carrier protein] synthase
VLFPGEGFDLILGIGIDLVNIKRMEIACKRRTQHFQRKLFSPREIRYCSSKKNLFLHLSANFAAKEAFIKAVGTGLIKGQKWTDIEIVRDELGAPKVNLLGPMKKLVKKRGVNQILLSLSHTKDYAVSVVVLTG